MRKDFMKKIHAIISLLGLLILTIFATSCLKDNYIDFSKVKPIVEFLDAQAQTGGYALSMPAFNQAAPDSVFVRVNVTGQYPLTTDLSVTISVDQATLDAYNTANASSPLTLLPTAMYSMPSTKVTVKANQRVGLFPILMNSAAIGAAQNYGLPLKITDASGQIISGNFGTIIISPYVPTPNAFEGNYLRTGTLTIGNGSPIQINETRYLNSVNSGTSQTFVSHFNNQSLSFQVMYNGDSSMSFVPAIGTKAAVNNLPNSNPNSTVTSSIVTIKGGKAIMTMNYFFFDSQNRQNTFKEIWKQQ